MANHETMRIGRCYVLAELQRRGAREIATTGNVRNFRIRASKRDSSGTVYIRVKAKRVGDWQCSSNEGKPGKKPKSPETIFWIFVDIGTKKHPEFWIVPDWWIRNDIYETHQDWLRSHGGTRPVTPESTHHAIRKERIEEWKDRWEILGIF